MKGEKEDIKNKENLEIKEEEKQKKDQLNEMVINEPLIINGKKDEIKEGDIKISQEEKDELNVEKKVDGEQMK